MTRHAGTIRPLLVQLLPVLGEQFLALAVGFTDKWLAGNLFADEAPLAAVGLVAYCLAFLPAVFAVPAVAATALVARSIGAGDPAAARRFAAQAVLLGAVLTAAGLVAAAAFGPGFVRGLGLPAASADLAVRYLAIVIPALPLMMLIHVGVAVLRGAGDMTAGLVAMTTVNLVNAAASFALAAGVGGLPRLGWDGLAWGTFAGYCCGAVCVGLLLARPAAGLRPDRTDWRPHRDTLRRLLRTGLPAGVDAAANSACHLTFPRSSTGSATSMRRPTRWRSPSSRWPFSRGARSRSRRRPSPASFSGPATSAGPGGACGRRPWPAPR